MRTRSSPPSVPNILTCPRKATIQWSRRCETTSQQSLYPQWRSQNQCGCCGLNRSLNRSLNRPLNQLLEVLLWCRESGLLAKITGLTRLATPPVALQRLATDQEIEPEPMPEQRNDKSNGRLSESMMTGLSDKILTRTRRRELKKMRLRISTRPRRRGRYGFRR